VPFALVVLALALLATPLPPTAAGPQPMPASLTAAQQAGPRIVQPLAMPRRDVDRQLRQAWQRLEVVVEQYNEARLALRRTRERSAALSARIAPLAAAMRAREARVGGLAARAYRAGGGAAEVSGLLAATSPEQFADRLMIIRRLTTQQTRAIKALTTARRGYETTRAALGVLAAQQREHQRRLGERKRHILAQINRLEQAGGGAPWGGRRVVDGYVPAYAPGQAGAAVRFAYRQLGKPYQWGGSGPGGYDCSGLTSAAWGRAGKGLPHNSAAQWNAVHPVSRAELRQGDLVFYYSDIHHVAIYVGGGRIVHAPNYGERVRVERMAYAPIYGFGRP